MLLSELAETLTKFFEICDFKPFRNVSSTRSILFSIVIAFAYVLFPDM